MAALCGVHCLNTLLQGPYFSEIELAQESFLRPSVSSCCYFASRCCFLLQLCKIYAPRPVCCPISQALLQIAQELDALEHQFMAEGGMEGSDYLRFVAEDSGNVANDGMFSIQVGTFLPALLNAASLKHILDDRMLRTNVLTVHGVRTPLTSWLWFCRF